MMRAWGWPGLFVAVLLLALALRLPRLALRPMHTDEAVHGIKFGQLLEQGQYRYDPVECHGPTLNYFTLAPAWLLGQTTLAAVTETTLRLVPVFFGVLLVGLHGLLVPIFSAKRKRSPAWPLATAAAFLAAISPAMTFYSRYYIQEMLFVCFAFGVLLCGFLLVMRPSWPRALATGGFLGLLMATKETWVLVAFALVSAGIATAWLQRGNSGGAWPGKMPWRYSLGMLGVAMAIAVLFFTSFLKNPGGLGDAVLAYTTYIRRGVGDTAHVQPWYRYGQWLLWYKMPGAPLHSELLVGVLAVPGIAAAFCRQSMLPGLNRRFLRFLVIYTGILTAVFTLMPYKTPWNALIFWHGFILLAGAGTVVLFSALSNASPMSCWKHLASSLLRAKGREEASSMTERTRRGTGRRTARIAVVLLLLLASAQLVWQNIRANFRDYADPANPWVYAHPTSDVFDMVQALQRLAAAVPEGRSLEVHVMASNSDYWPLPWYLRDFSRVGWWDHVPEDVPAAPVLLITPDLEPALLEKLYEKPPPGQRALYVPLFERTLCLRPGREMRGYVQKKLWDRAQPELQP